MVVSHYWTNHFAPTHRYLHALFGYWILLARRSTATTRRAIHKTPIWTEGDHSTLWIWLEHSIWFGALKEGDQTAVSPCVFFHSDFTLRAARSWSRSQFRDRIEILRSSLKFDRDRDFSLVIGSFPPIILKCILCHLAVNIELNYRYQ